MGGWVEGDGGTPSHQKHKPNFKSSENCNEIFTTNYILKSNELLLRYIFKKCKELLFALQI